MLRMYTVSRSQWQRTHVRCVGAGTDTHEPARSHRSWTADASAAARSIPAPARAASIRTKRSRNRPAHAAQRRLAVDARARRRRPPARPAPRRAHARRSHPRPGPRRRIRGRARARPTAPCGAASARRSARAGPGVMPSTSDVVALLVLFDLLPVRDDRVGGVGVDVAEHVRMAADELGVHRRGRRRRS